MLNWMTGLMEEEIHRANSTGPSEFRFVLTGQKQKPSSFLPSPIPCSVSLTFLVCTCRLGGALYASRAKLLWDRDLFDNNCVIPNQNACDGHIGGSPTQEPHIGHSAFLNLLHKGVPFHVFQQCLWKIGRHSTMVDVIPDPELLDPTSSPQVSGVHEATQKGDISWVFCVLLN